MNRLPVKLKQKIVDILPISVDVLVFGWNTRKIINLKTEEVSSVEAWTFLNGSANLNSGIRRGVLVNGKRIFGFEAMSDRLSALGCPCTVDEAKALVKQAVDLNIPFAKLMRTSDWTTSPDNYDGKNSWILMSNIKNLRDDMDAKLNVELRKYGFKLYTEGKPSR
jgi:hypothetical protein